MRYYVQMFQQKSRKVYFILLSVFIVSFLLRQQKVPLPDALMAHVSNFAITGGLFLLSSDSLLLNKPFTHKHLILELLPFAALNIIMELFIRADTIKIGIVEFTNFNTPDVIDMLYGLASLTIIYFVIMKTSKTVPIKKKLHKVAS